jgi:hypothetical protein
MPVRLSAELLADVPGRSVGHLILFVPVVHVYTLPFE